MRVILVLIICLVSVYGESDEDMISPSGRSDESIKNEFKRGNVAPLMEWMLKRFPEICIMSPDFLAPTLGFTAECAIEDASANLQEKLTENSKQALLSVSTSCNNEDAAECHRNKCLLKKSLEAASVITKESPSLSRRTFKRCMTKASNDEKLIKAFKEQFYQGYVDPLAGLLFNRPKNLCRQLIDVYLQKSGKIEQCLSDASKSSDIILTTNEQQELLSINSSCGPKDDHECNRNMCILRKDLELLFSLYKRSPSSNKSVVDRCLNLVILGSSSGNKVDEM